MLIAIMFLVLGAQFSAERVRDKLMPWSSTAVSCSGVIMSNIDSCIYGKEAG